MFRSAEIYRSLDVEKIQTEFIKYDNSVCNMCEENNRIKKCIARNGNFDLLHYSGMRCALLYVYSKHNGKRHHIHMLNAPDWS